MSRRDPPLDGQSPYRPGRRTRGAHADRIDPVEEAVAAVLDALDLHVARMPLATRLVDQALVLDRLIEALAERERALEGEEADHA